MIQGFEDHFSSPDEAVEPPSVIINIDTHIFLADLRESLGELIVDVRACRHCKNVVQFF